MVEEFFLDKMSQQIQSINKNLLSKLIPCPGTYIVTQDGTYVQKWYK